MIHRHYRTATDIQGPLVLVEVTENVHYQELVEIEVAGERAGSGRQPGADSAF